MMKKKNRFIMILVTVLLLSLVGNIFAHANSERIDSQAEIEIIEHEKWIERKDIDTKKVLMLSGDKKSQIQLQYDKTRYVSATEAVDIYLDETQGEYRFKEGKLNAFYNRKSLYTKKNNEKTDITDKKAVEIAKAHAREYYGKEIELFSLERVYEDQALGTMNVEFYMRYGKDNFVYGPSLSVYISKGGTVIGSANSNGTVYNTFDEKSIEDIKYEEIERFVDHQVRAAFGDNYISHTIDKVRLEYANERFFLLVAVEVERMLGEQAIVTAEVYNYEIEQ